MGQGVGVLKRGTGTRLRTMKWAATLNKLQFLTFGQKQCLYVTHSALHALKN